METLETFSQLFEESKEQRDLQEGSNLLVQVLDINENFVTVGAALKSDGRIPTEEFLDSNNELEIKVGDNIEVEIELLENGMGETVLSRHNARRKSVWRKIEDAMENDGILEGVIQSRVRGGFSVALEGLRAFLPGSLADVYPTPMLDEMLIGKTQQFKPIKINRRRNSVVLSRRAVIERNSANAPDLLARFQEDMRVTGRVRTLVDYGAFIEIGEGAFGLLHITDMSWKHTSDITQLMKEGDEIETVILRIDRARNRISLGRKQLLPNPWEFFERRHPVNSRTFGKVSKILDYGIFVEIDGELQGLVHTSEMSWSKRSINPSTMVDIGDEVEVMILEIDQTRRRVSLGMKQCQNNPWQEFATAYRKNDKIIGVIRSINEHGIFVGLPGDIEGLVRMADISYDEKPEEAMQNYQKEQEIEAMVLSIEPERERVALGIKQVGDEKFNSFAEGHLVKADLKIKIISIEEKGANIETVPDGVRGWLPIREISEEHIDNVSSRLKEGEEHDAILLETKHRSKSVIVSLKERSRKNREQIMQAQKGGQATTKLGALLQAKLQEANEAEEPEKAE